VILERSTTYWSVGITLTWHPEGARDEKGAKVDGWSGSVDYYDDGFAGDDDADSGTLCTEGTLRTRYVVADGRQQTALSAIVDTLIADAARLGIEFRISGKDSARLYVPGDGEWDSHPLPDGWRQLLAAEAERIGWVSYKPEAAR
jgi:hypothetical protein